MIEGKKKISVADVMGALAEVISTQRGSRALGDPTPTELFAGEHTLFLSINFSESYRLILCVNTVVSVTLSSGGAVEQLGKLLKIFRLLLFIRSPRLFLKETSLLHHSVVLPQTVVSLLRSQFRPTAVALMRIISSCPDQSTIQIQALDSLGSLLAAQEASEGQWASGVMELL